MSLAIFFPEIYTKQTVGTFYHNQKNGQYMMEIGYKIPKKQVKNWNSAHSCHDIAVAVLRALGPSLNLGQPQKCIKI